jgi:acyl-CoA thioesterase FadM
LAHYINLVRVPALVLRNSFGKLPRLNVLDTDEIKCRVLPWDLDFNFHLNNSRYLSYMDYARIRLIARLGLINNFFSRKYTGLVGSIDVTYRRSLDFNVRFTISSRMLCWDDKWFYTEQVFRGPKGLATHALVKTLFRGPHGNINPQSIVDRIEPGLASPPLSRRLLEWNASIRETLHAAETAAASTPSHG